MDKCRICLRCRKNVLSIYMKADGITYAEMISSFANVKIRNEDGFSDKICRSCRGKLTDAYNFKMEIERAEMVLQETSNLKRINFSNLQDIKIKIEIETDCKPLLPSKENFSDKLFKEGFDCLSYNNTVIKKIEHSECENSNKKKKALSVGEFLNSIKTESDNDCDYQDYEIGADEYHSDTGSNYSNDTKTKYMKKKKVKQSKNPISDQKGDWFKPLLSKPIKPKYIADLRLARTDPLVKKPRARKPPTTKIKICPYCGKLFQNLNSHILLHTAEKKFKCDQCEKAFYTENVLRAHIKLHGATKKFKCDQCIAAFVSPTSLKSHMLVHDDEKKHVCDVCNKAFKKKHLLKRHKMIHNFGDKPIKCELCPMTFITKYNLRHHMRVHTGERPFRCEICSQPYSYKHDFNRHCLKKHGVFMKRRTVRVMNEEVLQQERAIMRELSLRAHGIIKGDEIENPFDGPQAAMAYEQAMKAIEENKIPIF
ncbi:hypothetical protein PYW08_014846 [Mythimna loreyi]|uniref:Uncharacterized protein n=1 Tax=Mythimna loreyi TaxID=667449 RepID=A0ACC2R3A1_9NEOP|nr:hypothetical protein PYW08_014846 [Mythimna loreyi]